MAMYKRFSMLNVLCSVINSAEYGSLDSILAQYFIDNFENLSKLNIHDVASHCYCTRQSVRRFCNKIGFPNFAALKKYSIRYKHIQWEHLNRLSMDSFNSSLSVKINDAISNIDSCIERGDFNQLVQMIHDSDSVIIMVDESIKSLVSSFQRSMIYCNRLVKIISNTFNGDSMLENMYELDKKNSNPTLEALGDEDLVITISMTGNFARATKDLIEQLDSKNILLTVNRDEDLSYSYEKVYYLSDVDHGHEGINAYTIYGLNYYLDNLFSIYFETYGDQELLNVQPQ